MLSRTLLRFLSIRTECYKELKGRKGRREGGGKGGGMWSEGVAISDGDTEFFQY